MARSYYDKLLGCVEQVRARIGDFEPRVALTLGSGLGPVAESMEIVLP